MIFRTKKKVLRFPEKVFDIIYHWNRVFETILTVYFGKNYFRIYLGDPVYVQNSKGPVEELDLDFVLGLPKSI